MAGSAEGMGRTSARGPSKELGGFPWNGNVCGRCDGGRRRARRSRSQAARPPSMHGPDVHPPASRETDGRTSRSAHDGRGYCARACDQDRASDHETSLRDRLCA
jgi:hypothetical protein